MNQQTIEALLEPLNRPGMDRLIQYLRNTGFYTAPASTKHHLDHEGGLAEHSLNVHALLEQKAKIYGLDIPADSIAICGLLHDICKVNYYQRGTKNVKNEETGQWEKKEVWEINDPFPIGHGEKSVIRLQQFIKLTPDEALAIRWHMGAFDVSPSQMRTFNAACKMCPLIPILHTADYEASQILETDREPAPTT